MNYKLGSTGEMVRQIQKALAGAGLRVMVDGNFGPITEEAVKEFQKQKGLTPDGIVGPAALALIIPARLKKSKRIINEIIIHCTATPEGRECTVTEIRRWHIQRGFSDIGYHYVIHLDGSMEPGRDVDISGAHCTGHNAHSIGVCYVGGVAKNGTMPKDTRTTAQKETLLALLRDLRRLYPMATIRSHRDFANKACPSFDATAEYRNVR